ncbi:hypothetical protein BFF78_27940 [Streptomyces fodineus]|uniref:Uncharacterized protein n=1 Tax=Streptomyces fodineus TaxID=1904616 RepID=A0A1D7YFR1_9ACTN|nr:hypothetical protein BFF78_27940 [Streptomyces fodineus]
MPDEALRERIPGVPPDEVERWKTMRTDTAGAILGGNVADLFGPKPDLKQGDPPDDMQVQPTAYSSEARKPRP